MRTTLALLVSTALALAHPSQSAAQEDGTPLNERTKTEPRSAGRQDARPAVAPDLVGLAKRSVALAQAGDDLPEARRLIGNLRADARFEDQPQDFRFSVIGVAGYIEMRDGEPEAARTLFRQALQIQDTDPDLWYWLSWVEAALARHDDAALSLAALFRRAPEQIDNLPDEHIWRLVNEPEVSAAARTELLQAIFDSGWKREALGGAGRFHYELALARAIEGDVTAQRRIVPGVDDPTDIVRMRSDKRFDAVIDRDDPALAPRAAAERRVARLQAQVRRAPERLDIVAELQSALLVAGRFQEMITLADDVQSAIDAAPDGKPPYEDMDPLPWVQNLHAKALEALGRFDESLALLEAASRLEEKGVPNVSQALNLAQMYASLGRADDALAAADRAGNDMSGYGRMVKASAEQRAHLLKGELDAAAKALDYLRENRSISEAIFLSALVDAGDLDAAAAVLVAQLASPEHRAQALFEMQTFNSFPTLPGEVAATANWKALIARPDVQAAAAKVGRIAKVDLYRWE
ncbi:MAG: hypothetical protein NT046_03990 [Arenimonas sp.]|nr:hypothetical protein [Arenimonas sp.]